MIPPKCVLVTKNTETATPEPSPVPLFRLFYVFLPETSLLKQVRFQMVVASRALSEIGQEAVFYGALVAVAGDPFDASLIAVGKAAPAATLGIVGGAVADALPRRIGLGLGYAGQAALCVLVPVFLGTDFGALLLLVTGVSVLNQIIGPGEKAVIPLVSSRAQIATAAAILSVADSVGTGVGGGFIAPVLMKTTGIHALLFVCAGFLAFAAVRVLSLPLQREVGFKQALQRLKLSEVDMGLRSALDWLLGWPAIATMITVGVVVSVLNMSMNTLGPSYVGSALEANPADAVYVFAPGSIAALGALLVGPKLIDKTGERWLACVAVFVQVGALFGLAFIDQLAPILAPISPANLLRLFGQEPSDALLAASFVSIFIGFSASLSSLAVQTYLNRRVPATQQGRTFGLQSVLTNAVAIIPLILFGAIGAATSVKNILFWAPWIVLAVIYALLLIASRMTGRERPKGREVLASFWQEPDAAQEPVS
jgi:MFS transporter, DHA3 family, macrolide efflux protein